MSLRTVVKEVVRRQCIRRSIHISPRRLQEPSPHEPKLSLVGTLSRALAKNVPGNPSALDEIPPEHLTNPFTSPLKSKTRKINPPVTGVPVPPGYDANAYRDSFIIAKSGNDPTSEDLDVLLRLMDFDSPMGEMKGEAMAIWREMRSRGVIPTEAGYLALLRIAGKLGDTLMQDEIVETFPKDGVQLSPPLLHCLLEGLIANHEIERAIFLFRDIRARGILPRIRTYRFLISQCIEANEVEEAFRIMIDLKDVYGNDSVIESQWWQVLDCAAKNGFLEGTLHCWQHLQDLSGITFPEGLCLHVLSCAAQHGQPALATSVFNALSSLGIKYSEHHFLPLVEAYTRCGDIRQAFIVLNIMRESSLSPPQLSHLNFLSQTIAKDTKTLDKAFFALQDIVQKEGKTADITAFNILLKACLLLDDASRAISTYRDAPILKVRPNLETFNLLLASAGLVGHVELAMYILSDLKAAQITPNEETYGRVILTCLHQPDNTYEQAFLYLEEMKAAGWIPSSGLYASFVKKCAYHNDDRAVKLLEEMERVGHDTKRLKRTIEEQTRLGANSKLFDQGSGRYSRRHEAQMEEEMETEKLISQRTDRYSYDGLEYQSRGRDSRPFSGEERDGRFNPRMDDREDRYTGQSDRNGRYVDSRERRGYNDSRGRGDDRDLL